MTLKDIVKECDLSVEAGKSHVDNTVTGGYVSDLLSDVMANSEEGNVWITLQTHVNVIAVAALKDLAGIIFVHNRKPDSETKERAEEKNIPLLMSALTAYELVGKLNNMGIH